MRTNLPPTQARPPASRLLPGLTAALIATALLSTPQADAITAHPTAARATALAGTHLAINTRDPDLALPAGTTLAKPKILDLTAPRLALRKRIEPDARTTPRPSTSQQPGPAHPTVSASAAESTPEPTGTFTLAPEPTGAFTPAPEQTDDSASTHPIPALTLAVTSALLAAALAGLLIHRRRRRRPLDATTTPAPPARAQPAAPAEPSGAVRLDKALRTLAQQATQHGHPHLPEVRAARIGPRTLEVLPQEGASAPPTPFTAGTNGWWQLPADAHLVDDEQAHTVPAPYPALATVGTTAQGALLLANLTQLPVLLLDGEAAHINEVCTALTLELATSPWSAGTDITLIGFGEDLPRLLPARRITHAPHPADAARAVTERLLEAHQRPSSEHRPHLLLCTKALGADAARQFADLITTAQDTRIALIAPATGAAAHFPAADILNASLTTPQPFASLDTDITLQRLTHTAYQRITTALTATGPSAHTATEVQPEARHDPTDQQPASALAKTPTSQAAGTHPGVCPPTPDTPAPSARQTTAPHQSTSRPASAHDGTAESQVFPCLLAALADSSVTPPASPAPDPTTPADTATGNPPQDHTPPSPDPHTSHTHRTSHTSTSTSTSTSHAPDHDPNAPEIRVLGPLEVDRVHTTGHGPRIAQLAALLYFRPHHSADTLCTDMDPHTPWSTATLNARLQGLRRALGNDPTGNPYVPRRHSADDPYQLSPAIRCDWTTFLRYTEHALPKGPAGLEDLEKALQLVRGRPFGPRPLPWTQPLQQEMTTKIVQVAHTVARHRTPNGPHHNLTKARQAITTGLDVDDSAELLYRDWIRIEATAGNRPGLHTAITRLQHTNHTLGCPLEKETQDLIHTLTTPTTSPHPT
ncbi:hypothetical protein ACFYNL_38220 [Streptomyces sp. NPDC007808]|uniref:hypothetical protein n=1 Tax=Streptomyces sp. NPDC007808 TaxID=3364779 RepID=UPI003684A84C